MEELRGLTSAAAFYRWIRTHQYRGELTPDQPCDYTSSCANGFDQMIARMMRENP